MVYNGSLWHGGGANRTDRRRVGVAMNYCAGYIRQQENQQLGIPREVAAQFSPRLQELVGYSLYNGLIGHIDKTHPMELLGRKPDEQDGLGYRRIVTSADRQPANATRCDRDVFYRFYASEFSYFSAKVRPALRYKRIPTSRSCRRRRPTRT